MNRPAQIAIGTKVAGLFRLDERLGAGNSGVVYRAYHLDQRRHVALKLLNPEVQLDRTRRRYTSSFRHRYAVPLREKGRDRSLDLHFVIMDLVEGQDLRSVLSGQVLRPKRAVRLCRQLLDALASAHRAGLVHRDLKPSKILLTENPDNGREEVRILGFGLAEAANPLNLGGDLEAVLKHAEQLRRRIRRRDPKLVTTTRLKPVVACVHAHKTDFEDLAYVSPEVALNRGSDARADLYSVGAILYEALSRRRVFEADPGALDPLEELKLRIEADPPRDLAQIAPHVPPALCAEVMKSLSKAPSDRHNTAAEMRGALKEALQRVSLKDPSQQAEQPTVVVKERGDSREPARPQFRITLPTGARCPMCKKLLQEWGTALCAVCETPHHASCFRVQGQCGVPECGGDRCLVPDGQEREEAVDPGGVVASLSWRFVVVGLLLLALGGVTWVYKGGELGFFGALSGKYSRFVPGGSVEPPEWFNQLEVGLRPPRLPAHFRYGDEGEYINKQDGSVFVWVQPAEFKAGDPNGDSVEVVAVEGFFIGKYEVTWGQFRRYCDQEALALPKKTDADSGMEYEVTPNHPVFNVTAAEADAYCTWAKVRLPTDHEWELAARGSTKTNPFPWGDAEPTRQHGLPASDDAYTTSAVGSYAPDYSPYKCFDMFGNVGEWIAGSGDDRVARGAFFKRLYEKADLSADTRQPRLGFRLAADVPPGD